MQPPEVLKFTDLDVPITAVTWQGLQSLPGASWTRVKFNVPANLYDREPVKLVHEWLVQNCVGQWRSSSFPDIRSKNSETTMVLKFENRDDALMFKLRGGHQAWEESS